MQEADNTVKRVDNKSTGIFKNYADIYCQEWNKINEDIEHDILTLPRDEMIETVIPKIEKHWKGKMAAKWSFTHVGYEDAFNETLIFMFMEGFEDFKRKKLDGVDVHIYPYFLKKMKSICYKLRREKFGFKSDFDYDTYLKMKYISEEYDVDMCIRNAYLFATFIKVTITCIIRVLECYKSVLSYEKIHENKRT